MMNKLKSILSLILCFVCIGGATAVNAQSGADKVLVAGKKPLRQSEVNRLIEFYEWLLDATFTADERGQFQKYVEADFRQDAAAARKNADEALAAFAKVRALDADGQRTTREAAAPGFVADLRKTANEPDSRFLIEIYERGQTGGAANSNDDSASGDDLKPQTGKSGGAAASQNLVGKWIRRGGAGGFRDYTGKTKYNSGEEFIFEFFADGTMRYGYEKSVLSIIQCKISETTKIPGRYSISGNQLTMNLAAGTSVGTSSCEKKDNFKKTLSASSLTKTFVVKNLESVFRPDAPLILCLDGADGDACFEKDVPFNSNR